jgi:hypothetical protein
MKKAILTTGLFSLVMVLTSFSSNEEITTTTTTSKKEIKAETFKIENVKLEINGAGATGGNKKVD